MAFTKITAAGIGSTETVTLDGLSVINNGSFGGNLTVGGTITYEDVTNVDSVGIITARSNILVGSGITLSPDGDIFFTGIMTGNGSGLSNVGVDTAVIFTDKISLPDNGRINLGIASDLKIYHDGTNSRIDSEVGSFIIRDTGEVEKFKINGYGSTFNDDIILQNDGDKIRIGAGDDLQLYHNGTESWITNDTGTLNILNDGDTQIKNRADNQYIAKFEQGGSCELYEANSKKLETDSSGITVTGRVAATSMNVGAAVTISESGICAAGIGITVANINSGQIGGRRNLIINGDMRVAQRGTSFTSDGYGIDRLWWGMFGMDQAQTTRTQSTDTPSGFKNSQKINVTTVETSIESGERAYIRYRIEGQDLQQLATGTSGAKKLTLSFYAKTASNNSGHQYSIYLSNHDISGNDRIQTRAFTVTSTWQRFTFTFDGQEAIVIRNDNDYGLQLYISLAAYSSYEASAITSWTDSTYKVVSGQSNFLASTNNDFYITGVQLEVGSQATAFEHRSFAEELYACKRYFQNHAPNYSDHMMWGTGRAESNTGRIGIPVSVPMRAAPTVAVTANRLMRYDGNASDSTDTPSIFAAGSWLSESNIYTLDFGGHSLSHNNMYQLTSGGGTGITLDSEL